MTDRAVCQSCWNEFPVTGAGPAPALCPACSGEAVEETDSPLAELLADRAWRRGNVLVIDRFEPAFPDACIKCNAPTEVKVRRHVYWHHPAIYLALLLWVVGYLVAALAARKDAVLWVPACARHREMRVKAMLLAWGLLGLGVMVLCVSADLEGPWLALAGGGGEGCPPALAQGSLAARNMRPGLRVHPGSTHALPASRCSPTARPAGGRRQGSMDGERGAESGDSDPSNRTRSVLPRGPAERGPAGPPRSPPSTLTGATGRP